MNQKNKGVSKNGKQAVLLIHGVGEQRPMVSLRNFVISVWSKDKSIKRKGRGADGLWSKPYPHSHSYELRRLTTSENDAGIRTDFFELYWAHLMSDNKLSHITRWAKILLLRKPATVPKHLKLVYWTLIGLATAWILLVLISPLLSNSFPYIQLSLFSLPIFAWVITAILGAFTNIVGDAARYLDPSPSNVGKRDEIRRLGVDVLRSLHSDDNGYDRIVLVGHSLGSVIGYDILYHTWAELNSDWNKSNPSTEHLTKLEQAVRDMENGIEIEIDKFQDLQNKCLTELQERGSPWRVSDFVTLGSPLAHSEILLASDSKHLEEKFNDREIASCPPILETSNHDEVKKTFSYPANEQARRPHHAAVFGPTRWTNLYFQAKYIVWGDLIGGALRDVLGLGIRDVKVSIKRRWGFLSHTLYWLPERNSDYDAEHIAALRNALDLSEMHTD